MEGVQRRNILLVVSAIGYACIARYVDRISLTYFPDDQAFWSFIGLNALLFGLYFILLRKAFHFTGRDILVWAFLFRLLFMGMYPNLSDDYYRFVWDGRLLANGENPYLVMPDSVRNDSTIKALELDGGVFEGLNSKQYYTVYPPLNQVVFAVSAWIGGNDLYSTVVAMRCILLAADMAVILILLALLRHFGFSDKRAAIYALNPLVIYELTGNLHFEGMMLLGVLGAILLLVKMQQKYAGLALAALVFAAGVLIKLLPLLYLPFFLKRIGFTRSIFFYVGIGAVVALGFLPFVSEELLANMGSSLDLYFRRFEFNASFYYLARWVGEQASGYNLIQYIGPAMGGTVLIGAFVLFLRDRNREWSSIFKPLLFVLTLYLFCATIVHPWYLVPLVAFTAFTNMRYALVWTALIPLSYFKYINGDYPEPYAFIVIEYTALVGFMVWELFIQPKREQKEEQTALLEKS